MTVEKLEATYEGRVKLKAIRIATNYYNAQLLVVLYGLVLDMLSPYFYLSGHVATFYVGVSWVPILFTLLSVGYCSVDPEKYVEDTRI